MRGSVLRILFLYSLIPLRTFELFLIEIMRFMKKIVFPVLSLLVTGALITSCKKKDKDDDYEPPPYVPTLLCDGNGTTAYFPLQIGNKYSYAYKFNGTAQADRNYTVTKDTVITGLTYKKIQRDNAASIYELVRIDPATNNVYGYLPAAAKEILLIPGKPVIDQVLESATPGYKAKITNLSGVYKTGSCSYTGLLEVTEYDASGKAVTVFQYKQGVGKVHTAFLTGTDTQDYQLKSVTLN